MGGELKSEGTKTVEELTTYFLPAVVARRNALRELLNRAALPPNDVVDKLRNK